MSVLSLVERKEDLSTRSILSGVLMVRQMVK